jgi:hypothetical protein
MFSVQLEETEWNQVVSALAQAPWNIANPLLMKISNQLRAQKESEQSTIKQHPTGDGEDLPLNGRSPLLR